MTEKKDKPTPLAERWKDDQFKVTPPKGKESESNARADSVVVVPSAGSIALTEQIHQWRARMLQPFSVRADADEPPEKKPAAGEDAPAEEGAAPGGAEEPPAADDLGEVNKELIAAELELEFAQKDMRAAQKLEKGKGTKDTSGLTELLELTKKVEAAKEKVIKLERQLEIANAQSVAMPTPAPVDPNAAATEQQGKQQEFEGAQQDKELAAKSEAETSKQAQEEVAQVAQQAHEQTMQQAQQAHEFALAQKTSETEVQKAKIGAKAKPAAKADAVDIEKARLVTINGLHVAVDEHGRVADALARADSDVLDYNPVTVRADRDAPVMVDNTPIMKSGAGVLFITDGGRVLLGLRAEPGEYYDHWGIFGGHQEDGETLEMTAVREVVEETGHVTAATDNDSGVALPAPLQLIAQTVVDSTVFSYFVHVCNEPFDVQLNDEHHAYGWYAMGEEPQPMIPGLSVVLNSPEVRKLRLKKMNEMDIAKAMSYGELPSPTKYANISMYRMRVTGTGRAFRRGDGKKIPDEYVIRPPELYLTEEFVQRCNGMDVIFEHPKKKVLNSDEYRDRKVGTSMLAYIAGDEIWCVAKIYDTDTITILDSQPMSTSPSVVFGDKTVNSTIALSNGTQLLIEGKPSLLDHLAICDIGVWDKGGEPRGIESNLVGMQ
jgi:8-oxo-dGTP pyrophosphatase MutT (NUDIX family)